MTIENSSPEEEFPWATFMKDLPAYVRLEFAGQSPEAIYPEWAFHIATSVECQNAYYQELRRQSLAQANIAVNAAQPGKAVSLLHQLRQANLSPLIPPPAPSWLERVLTHGRAWVDAGTENWRRLQVSLADLSLVSTPAPALTGLMSDMPTTRPINLSTLHIAPAQAGFDLSLTVQKEPTDATQEQFQVEVMLTLFDRFGDYAGVDLYLSWDEATRQATTNAFGRALFTGLPAAQAKAMSLVVIFPDDNTD